MAWRRVDVGVRGERKERTISAESWEFGAGMEYVRFVVEASKVAPKYVG